MYIFEIVIPGTWLDHGDNAKNWSIENILSSIYGQFFEANISLNLFTQALKVSYTSDLRKIREDYTKILRETEESIRPNHAYQIDIEEYERIYFEAETAAKRKFWENGNAPSLFVNSEPMMHARNFLYSFDMVDKFFRILLKEEGVPVELNDIYSRMAEKFPDLRGVRNSVQHLEDRSRGLGSSKKEINPQPISNHMINAQNGGVIVMNSLNGTNYICTMENGVCGKIDVSPNSLKGLQSIVQSSLNAFQWKGPKRHLPNL